MSSPSRSCGPGAGSRPSPRIPAPGDEVILREVLMEQRQVASAISAWILELSQISPLTFFPMPFRWERGPSGDDPEYSDNWLFQKVKFHSMSTGAASIPGYAAAIISAGDRRRVDMLIVALERTVVCRMTTRTAQIIITFAASVKSARERVCGSWMPENSDGERNSLGFCADACLLPKTNNDTQLTATTEIVAERIPRLPRLSLSTRPVDRTGSALCNCRVRSSDQRANRRKRSLSLRCPIIHAELGIT